MAESPIRSPQPPEDSALVTKNWCYTTLKAAKFTFVWTIKYFSLRCKQMGESIKSSEFSAGANDKAKWYLLLFPYGCNNESKNYLSLFLGLASCNDTEVWTKYKFAILNRKRKETHKQSLRKRFKQGCEYGCWKFIHRDCLLNEASGLISDDKVSIFCEVTVLTDSVNLSGQSKAVHFQVPECRLSEDLSSPLDSPRFSDVTLSVNGGDFNAHKVILAARSPVFAAMFEHDMEERKHNAVTITDVDHEVFREMLRFIYTGRVKSLDNMAEDLLAAADKYALDRLKVMCEEALCRKLSADNAVDILILADLHSADQLKAQAIDFINTHARDVMSTQGWKQTILSHPLLITEVFSAMATRMVPLIELL